MAGAVAVGRGRQKNVHGAAHGEGDGHREEGEGRGAPASDRANHGQVVHTLHTGCFRVRGNFDTPLNS